MDKHAKIRIRAWCKKLCQITTNIIWKKNRNLHALSLLDMILNGRFEEPYNKFPPDGPLTFLSLPEVKSRLSNKILSYAKLVFDSPECKKNRNESSINLLNNNKNNKMKLEINKCNDPELLKRLIDKLNDKIELTRKIILEQNEEKKILTKKVSRLESLLKSYKI
jgi:hypothetical protein